ncbi:MAG: hypothetical protein QOJ65_2359 [Fimbriimonadaceae bacterium]|jgi:protein involved in temperature-dependent protein secretion|nr:hypothetical protein [Fimbriimonadaceae bacterium]
MEERRSLFTFTPQEGTPQALHGLEEWQTAVNRDPANVNLRMTLCRVLARRGLYEEAIEQCRQCLELQDEGGQLSVSRRLRIVAMDTRLKRAMEKRGRRPTA